MSEYKRQIVVGVSVAAVMALVLAAGAVYLLPLQPTQTSSTTVPSSTTFTTSTTTATISTTTATSTMTSTTTQTTSSATTSTVPVTTTGTTTITTSVTSPTTTQIGPTVTVTVTQQVGTATVTVTTTAIQSVTLTTTVTSVERLEIVNATAVSPTQVQLYVRNTGSVGESVVDILLNGISLNGINGSGTTPALPITIAAGGTQKIMLSFSTPLPSGTYFITIRTG